MSRAQAGLPTDAVELAQLVVTSSLYALPGKGIGPVACSQSWPYPTHSSVDGGLGTIIRYSRQADAPPSVSLRRTSHGERCIIAKTAAGVDFSNRPGRFIVHALLDRTATLRPRHAFDGSLAGKFIRSWPTDKRVDSTLPEVRLSLTPPVVAEPWDWFDRTRAAVVVDAVLRWHRDGTLVCVWADDVEQLALLLAPVFFALPDGLTGDLTFSTYESEDEDEPSIALLGRTSAPPTGREVFDVRTTATQAISLPQEPSDLARRFVRVVGDRMAPAPAHIRSVEELEMWVSREETFAKDPATLSDAELVQFFGQPPAELAEQVRRHQSALPEVLSRLVSAGSVDTAKKVFDIAPPRERAGVLAALAKAMRQSLRDAPRFDRAFRAYECLGGDERALRREIERDVTRSINAGDRFTVPPRSTLRMLMEPAADQWPLTQQVEWLEQIGLDSVGPFRSWSWVSAALIAQHLLGRVSLSATYGKQLLATSPRETLSVIDDLARIDNASDNSLGHDMLQRLAALGPDCRTELVALAVRSKTLPDDSIYDVLLADLPLAQQRAAVADALPNLLAPYGIPPNVTFTETVAAKRRRTPSWVTFWRHD